jgi:hypothetical protein
MPDTSDKSKIYQLPHMQPPKAGHPRVAKDAEPLDFLLQIMRDPSIHMDTRIEAARAAMPYVPVPPKQSARKRR